jgi:hypothetical protein
MTTGNVTVNVTLDQNATPWKVNVDMDPIKIKGDATTRKIHWRLRGNAAGGKFLPSSFAWKGKKPPHGIFSSPSLSPHKKSLTISDQNPVSGQNSGDWGYALQVSLNGVTYNSTGTPTIHNN